MAIRIKVALLKPTDKLGTFVLDLRYHPGLALLAVRKTTGRYFGIRNTQYHLISSIGMRKAFGQDN